MLPPLADTKVQKFPIQKDVSPWDLPTGLAGTQMGVNTLLIHQVVRRLDGGKDPACLCIKGRNSNNNKKSSRSL